MKKSAALVALVLLLAIPVLSHGAGLTKVEKEKTYMAVKSLLIQGDTFVAIEYLNGLNPPIVAGENYSGLVRDFYWKEKSIERVVIFGRAGIQYCLGKAEKMEKTNFEGAMKLRSLAKTIAYDVASFTWPGWNEKGIVPEKSEIAAGLDCALLNLRLAKQLRKPAIKMSYAYWMLGAQYLAAKDHSNAVVNFTKAAAKAREAGDKLNEVVANGYGGIAKIAGETEKTQGEADYQVALSILNESSQKNAKFFVDQLKTAYKVFVPSPSTGK